MIVWGNLFCQRGTKCSPTSGAMRLLNHVVTSANSRYLSNCGSCCTKLQTHYVIVRYPWIFLLSTQKQIVKMMSRTSNGCNSTLCNTKLQASRTIRHCQHLCLLRPMVQLTSERIPYVRVSQTPSVICTERIPCRTWSWQVTFYPVPKISKHCTNLYTL